MELLSWEEAGRRMYHVGDRSGQIFKLGHIGRIRNGNARIPLLR